MHDNDKHVSDRHCMLSSSMFHELIKDSYNDGRRFCFILGAGASRESGIKTGTEMINEWREYLTDIEKTTPGILKERAELVGADDGVLNSVCSDEYEIKSEDYFSFHDLRYPCDPVISYSYFQRIMEGIYPSIGYYALAVLLENTENKLVISTNFDSLVEDSVFLYCGKHALVAGHESLASFIGSTENRSRPVVAKVHGDLLLHPKNRKEDMEGLKLSWKNSLAHALKQYVPIVIGYAGGDNTLMGLLEEMSSELDIIYWCTLSNDTKSIDSRILDFLGKVANGYLVNIQGFDRLMVELLNTLLGKVTYESPYMRMAQFHRERSDNYLHELNDMLTITCREYMRRNVSEVLDVVPTPEEKSHHTMTLSTFERLSDPSTDCDTSIDDKQLRAVQQHAIGLRKLADNSLEEALNHFKRALRIDDSNSMYCTSCGIAYFELCKFYEALSKWDDAYESSADKASLSYLANALALYALNARESSDSDLFARIIDRLLKVDAKLEQLNAEVKQKLYAETHYELGSFAREQGLFLEAKSLLLNAETCFMELHAANDNCNSGYDLSKVLGELAALAGDEDDFDKAREYWIRCLAIDKKNADELQTYDSRREFSTTLKDLGNCEYSLGDFDSARERWEHSLSIDEELVSACNNASNVRELAVSRYYISLTEQYHSGEKAKSYLLHAEDALNQLYNTSKEADKPDYAWDLSIIKEELGDIYFKQNMYASAILHWKDAYKLRKYVDSVFNTPSTRRYLSYIQGRLADYAQYYEGDLNYAEVKWLECEAIDRELNDRLDTPRSNRDLSVSLYALCTIAKRTSRNEEAEERWNECKQIYPNLAAELGEPSEQAEKVDFISLKRKSSFD